MNVYIQSAVLANMKLKIRINRRIQNDESEMTFILKSLQTVVMIHVRKITSFTILYLFVMINICQILICQIWLTKDKKCHNFVPDAKKLFGTKKYSFLLFFFASQKKLSFLFV